MALSLETKHIILLDPDPAVRRQTEGILQRAGFRVTSYADPAAAGRTLRLAQHDAVVATLAGDPDDTVRTLKRQASGAPLLLLCAPNRVRFGVRALRYGADDYLLRPPDPHELRTRVERILDRGELDSRIAYFQDELSKRAGATDVEARSPSMRAVLDRVMRVAPMRSTVLISGESGVGKELVARSIHFNSPRRSRPFIALNCAAMPASLIESELFGHERGAFTGAHARTRGKFEIAHRGTLFLDEIGEMEPGTQAKLLRVLDAGEFMRVGGDRSLRVDVRVIAATNADLEEMVAGARFRQDLYYRLKVVTVTVPPLRERRADLPHLVDTFLDQLSRANAVPRKTVLPEAMTALEGYDWPGNVRELKNLLESVLVSIPGDTVRMEDLPPVIRQAPAAGSPSPFAAGTTLAEMERALILTTLEHTGGNRTHSAALLGIGVRTLQRKIRTYDIAIAPQRRRQRTR